MALTDVYGISAQELAQTHEAEDLNALRMMVRDPIFSSDEPDLQQLRGAVPMPRSLLIASKNSTMIISAWPNLYKTACPTMKPLQQSNDETQIYDFFKANRNYFPKLEAIADRLRQKSAIPRMSFIIG